MDQKIKIDSFAGFHPLVNLLYFSAVIGFAMFFTHPACLGISLICAISYSLYMNGRKAAKFILVFMLPMLLFTALINPAFNHQGITILTYLPSGNPLTLESIVYGVAAATMLITVVSWFSCLNAVMTSDKLVYLFGRLIPALSLVLSMALRFVPRYREQLKIIANAQRCVGRGGTDGNIIQKMKHAVKIQSIMVTWALENAIETADSMNGRGYGLPGRSFFSLYRFDRRDGYALSYIAACSVIVISGTVSGAYSFRYFPSVRGLWTGLPTILLFIAYFALSIFPMIINIREDLLWRSIESKN
ncbi:MAG: energy-coupling factor transporter transmembrane protein EcfT [Clostridiales bacterium]|nr:energy-coupling factor transporter transmembrane protein EcfT [Clostridiales bacterium]